MPLLAPVLTRSLESALECAFACAFACAIAATPGDTTHYDVFNHGRLAGAMQVVTAGDSVLVRYGHQDRQRGPDVVATYRFAPDGTLRSRVVATGNRITRTPPREAERAEVRDGRLAWRAGRDTGSVPVAAGAWPLSSVDHPYELGALARALLGRPGVGRPIAQGGTATARVVVDTTLVAGGQAQRARLVALGMASLGESFVWLDEANAVLASSADWFITIRRGREALLPSLRAIERAVTTRASAALAARMAPPVTRALVIRDGDVFDSERGVVVPRQTVVIEGDRIVAVGPTASVAVPRGATVLEARGRTVLPGLWDMHTHFFSGSEAVSGLLHLASGVTTVRDLAADADDAVSARGRAAAGQLLYPRMLLGGFLEGPGAWAGPSEALVRTEAEATAWVARYDSLGYRQVKLYNLVHPDLVPTIVAEAKRRGLRVSGHVPRGLTVEQALALGFDEVQHAAFLMSTFFQDSLYLPTMRAYSQVASAVAPGFDPEAPRARQQRSPGRDAPGVRPGGCVDAADDAARAGRHAGGLGQHAAAGHLRPAGPALVGGRRADRGRHGQPRGHRVAGGTRGVRAGRHPRAGGAAAGHARVGPRDGRTARLREHRRGQGGGPRGGGRPAGGAHHRPATSRGGGAGRALVPLAPAARSGGPHAALT